MKISYFCLFLLFMHILTNFKFAYYFHLLLTSYFLQICYHVLDYLLIHELAALLFIDILRILKPSAIFKYQLKVVYCFGEESNSIS